MWPSLLPARQRFGVVRGIINAMRLVAQKLRWRRSVAVTVILLAGLYVLLMAFLPPPKPTLALQFHSGMVDTGQKATLPWPPSGEAAIGAVGYGVLQANNPDQSTPMASTAKIILALAVLRQKPLELGQAGPAITITSQDVALYRAELNRNGSVVPVELGEQLSEYQAFQALLLPSGNNIAGTLANWAFGSPEEYIAYASKMLSGMGLSKTHLDDVS